MLLFWWGSPPRIVEKLMGLAKIMDSGRFAANATFCKAALKSGRWLRDLCKSDPKCTSKVIPKSDARTPKFSECFANFDWKAFWKPSPLSNFLYKQFHALTGRNLRFQAVALDAPGPPSKHPKSQILVVFRIAFANFPTPRRRNDRKAHPPTSRF